MTLLQSPPETRTAVVEPIRPVDPPSGDRSGAAVADAQAVAQAAAAPEAVAGDRVRWGWGRLVVAALARMVLAVMCSLAVWAVLPALIGWQPTTVVTGSMQPRIMIGDVAVAKPTAVEDLRVGQLLLFPDPDHVDRLRLHRFVSVDGNGQIITRGDANEADDSSPVAPEDVDGVAVLRVPFLGMPMVWVHEGRWVLVAATAAAVVALMALSTLDRGLLAAGVPGPGDGSGPGRPPLAPGPTTSGRRGFPARLRTDPPTATAARRALPARLVPPVRHRIAVAAVAVTAVVTALAAVALTTAPAWAAYSARGTSTASLAAARYYSCDSAPTADRPYLYWKLDEASGASTAADATGNGRTGTYVNGASRTTAACGRGSAITLNGTSQYLTPTSTTAVAGPNTFTIGAWFKTGRGGMVASFGNARTGGSGQHDRKVYVTEAGRVYFGVYPGSAKTIASGAGYADNQWHHVVATLSGGGMRLYLDGRQVASDTSTTTAESYNGFWRFGYDTQGGWPEQPTSGYLAGSLDNVAVYTTALTATQVADHYGSR